MLLNHIPVEGSIYVSLNDIGKNEGAEIIKKYDELGFKIYASEGYRYVFK